MRLLVLLSALAIASIGSAFECSNGDTHYMCANLDRCWYELGFGSRADLKYLCDVQGIPTSSGGHGPNPRVEITEGPRSVTVAPGASAQLACTAINAVKVVVMPEMEAVSEAFVELDAMSAPTTQKVIQVIDEAYSFHEGWYVCVAFGSDGARDEVRAYLRIKDICATAMCEKPKVCSPDMYTGEYECICPGNCGKNFEPVCASDCTSYVNECTMRKETCEQGREDVFVVSQGFCSFEPTTPWFEQAPQDGYYQPGMSSFSARASVAQGQSVSYLWIFNGDLVGSGRTLNINLQSYHSGEWKLVAASCAGTYKAEHTFRVTVGDDNKPAERKEQCCKVWGDPHIITFDDRRYDYMGSCDYIIAEDLAGEWLVYGTYKACGDKSKQLSCIVSITVFYKGEKVQFLRMFRINHNGQEFSVPLGNSRYIGKLRIENEKMKYNIYIGNTGVRVSWDGITTSNVCLPSQCRGRVQGMCGNADCNPDNDFAGFLTSSAFGNRWAVDASNCDLEPENLPDRRKRPCEYVTTDERRRYEFRCNSILDIRSFSDCIHQTGKDRSALFDMCMFDMCSGLTIGGGCANRGDQRCDAEIGNKIHQAVLRGMSRMEAEAKYRPRTTVDPACMMGYGLAHDCVASGLFIDNFWREEAGCPTDDELPNIVVCP